MIYNGNENGFVLVMRANTLNIEYKIENQDVQVKKTHLIKIINKKRKLSAQIIKPNTHLINESLHEGYASFRHLLSLIKMGNAK